MLYGPFWCTYYGVSIQRRHWQPLSVHLWAYCTHPTHDVNDVIWCVKVHHNTGVYVPYSVRTVVWFPLRPTRTSVSAVWDGAYGFSSLSEKTGKSNGLEMDAECWSGPRLPRDLPLSRLALSQLSYPDVCLAWGYSSQKLDCVIPC